MNIILTGDYKHYHKGQVLNVSHRMAKALIDSGKAVAHKMMVDYKVTK